MPFADWKRNSWILSFDFGVRRRELTAEEQGELRKLWKKLVSLYHPDRFAHEPDKLATYEKLTAAINHAKDGGDIETLRQIADDPYGFI